MSVSLMMEPFAEMYLEESPDLRVIDEFCFLEIDELFIVSS